MASRRKNFFEQFPTLFFKCYGHIYIGDTICCNHFVPGDVNGDCKASADDVRTLLSYMFQERGLKPAQGKPRNIETFLNTWHEK